MENQFQARNLSSTTGYNAYFAEATGRNASNSGGAQFFMPDEGDAYSDENSDDDLASQYNLGNHLDSDRTTFSKNPVEPKYAENTGVPNPECKGLDGETSGLSPSVFICDSRALPRTNAASTPHMRNAEKNSTSPLGKVIAEREAADNADGRILYNADMENVTSNDSSQGTHRASHNDAMVCARDNIVSGYMSNSGEFAFSHGNDGSLSHDDRRNQRQSSGYLSEAEVAAGAAVVAAYETGNGNKSAQGKTVTLPRIKEISQAILDEIERMRTNPDNNSVDMTIDLSDGSTLDMKLRWRGNGMSVSFGAGSENMRGEIENGWGSLVLSAGNSGVMLESPRFDGDDKILTETSHYA